MPKKQRERRRRGDGAIYPIEQGGKVVRYAAAVELGIIGGRRRRKVVYGKTETEVAQKLKKLHADIMFGHDVAPERMTVEQFLLGWLKGITLDKSEGTANEYPGKVRRIIQHIGGQQLTALSTVHVEAMLTALRESGIGASTARDYRALLVGALNRA
jgi:hypothetical protein